MTTTSVDDEDRACFICGKFSCSIVSHRLLTLESLRRIDRRKDKSRSRSGTDSEQEPSELLRLRSLVTRSTAKPTKSPSSVLNVSSEAFESFPVKDASKTVMDYFRIFFASQGRSVLQGQEILSFDSDQYRLLLPQALQNRALCLSLVAMSATYVAIHDRQLESPDDALTVIYNQAFQGLRQQLHKERVNGMIASEPTILAAINLSMACGVAFADAEAAITHWHGVLALASRDSHHYYSGALNVFLDQMVYWLTLVANLRPGFTEWPVVVRSARLLPEVYGQAWQDLSFVHLHGDISATQVTELCWHACRATEILEYHAQNPHNNSLSVPPMTYFRYLRSMVEQKGAILFRRSHSSYTAIEAIVIAVNLHYCLVLSMTPWKAPIIFLCRQLRKVITESVTLSIGLVKTQYEISLDDSNLFLVWLLFVYLHAARLCKDEALLKWGEAALEPILTRIFRADQSGRTWQEDLLAGMRRFCWSNTFMHENFVQTCTELAGDDK